MTDEVLAWLSVSNEVQMDIIIEDIPVSVVLVHEAH